MYWLLDNNGNNCTLQLIYKRVRSIVFRYILASQETAFNYMYLFKKEKILLGASTFQSFLADTFWTWNLTKYQKMDSFKLSKVLLNILIENTLREIQLIETK